VSPIQPLLMQIYADGVCLVRTQFQQLKPTYATLPSPGVSCDSHIAPGLVRRSTPTTGCNTGFAPARAP
jgi:hypothetical protein